MMLPVAKHLAALMAHLVQASLTIALIVELLVPQITLLTLLDGTGAWIFGTPVVCAIGFAAVWACFGRSCKRLTDIARLFGRVYCSCSATDEWRCSAFGSLLRLAVYAAMSDCLEKIRDNHCCLAPLMAHLAQASLTIALVVEILVLQIKLLGTHLSTVLLEMSSELFHLESRALDSGFSGPRGPFWGREARQIRKGAPFRILEVPRWAVLGPRGPPNSKGSSLSNFGGPKEGRVGAMRPAKFERELPFEFWRSQGGPF